MDRFDLLELIANATWDVDKPAPLRIDGNKVTISRGDLFLQFDGTFKSFSDYLARLKRDKSITGYVWNQPENRGRLTLTSKGASVAWVLKQNKKKKEVK